MSDRLAYIKKAQEITDQVFTEILKFIKPGISEKTVAKKIDQLIRKYGGDKKPAFATLVCSGKRTALFHGPTSNRIIKNNEPIYLDIGASYRGWCSDMTRTIFVGKPTKDILNIYKLVKKVQEKQISMVKAGIPVAVIDQKGRDMLKKYDLDKYFIHSTGHGVGKLIHQKPRISYKSNELLRSGQVITIEPGVYLPGIGGVRIEDLLIVTKNGCINLTHSSKKLIQLN